MEILKSGGLCVYQEHFKEEAFIRRETQPASGAEAVASGHSFGGKAARRKSGVESVFLLRDSSETFMAGNQAYFISSLHAAPV